MRPSTCFLSTSILAAGVSAFYPVQFPGSGDDKTNSKRFYPVSLSEGESDKDAFKPLTLGMKKVQKVRRENSYPAVTASTPSMKDSMGINNDGKDFSYFSVVEFGSKGQKMWMLIDSGASSTWVMGSDCESVACMMHNTFGDEDSDSREKTDSDWSVKYGTGQVNGTIVKDTMSFAGFELKGISFGSASETSDDFIQYPMDGIMGLGPAKENKENPTLMQFMKKEKLIKKTIIGVNLQRNADDATDGQITFGDIDKSKFTGDVKYSPIVAGDVYRWEIQMDDVFVDGKAAKFSKRTAVLDTGTSFALFPLEDAKTIHSMIKGAEQNKQFFKVPCDTDTELEIEVSGVKYKIPPKDYVKEGDGMCDSYIVGSSPLGEDQWLLGAVFLKNVYTVFDFDERRVGLAARKYSKPSESKTTSSTTVTSTSTPSTSTSSSSSSSSSTAKPAQQDSEADPTNTSTAGTPKSTGKAEPDKKDKDKDSGAAAGLLMPRWLFAGVCASMGYSWYLSGVGV